MDSNIITVEFIAKLEKLYSNKLETAKVAKILVSNNKESADMVDMVANVSWYKWLKSYFIN